MFGIMYFLSYQVMGLCIGFKLFKSEKLPLRVLFGSVIGSFTIHWFPTITSLFLNFNKSSHMSAVLLFYLLGFLILFFCKINTKNIALLHKEDYLIFLLILPLFIYFIIILFTHTLLLHSDGSIYTGQCTYGDMNMHLGFITSIAKQGTFPPDYSILPGTRLAYPFLSDSISSSMYVMGSSLKTSYIFPMLFAFLQALYGMYSFAYVWLQKVSKAVLAFILFFFNGGFGFFYFIDSSLKNTNNFTRIFTEFYNTPTNLVSSNIRWSNVIVDMLIPQRATLFGWAMLFPILTLLYKAWKDNKKYYFVIAGILAGGLPMIHAHSFMALGFICSIWLLFSLRNKTENATKNKAVRKYIIIGGIICISLFQIIVFYFKYTNPTVFLLIGICFILVYFYFLIESFIIYLKLHNIKELLTTWGVFLILVLVFALPQLFTWTFRQASSSSFLRGVFNWSNDGDIYIWFYIKNIGITALFAVPAFLSAKKKDFEIALPSLFIWAVAEFIVFQPNTYDNNKLLLVAYLLICCLVSDYLIKFYNKLRNYSYQKPFAVLILFFAVTSAVLTMGREFVSEYELYPKDQVNLSKYIEENVPVDAVILTNTRHNNVVTSLTGRNIVCGSGSFLYFHGLDYQKQEDAVYRMYNFPDESVNLLNQYNVSYILIGPDEHESYPDLKEDIISQKYPCVFQTNDVCLYKVK